jgi:hypothetical protein
MLFLRMILRIFVRLPMCLSFVPQVRPVESKLGFDGTRWYRFTYEMLVPRRLYVVAPEVLLPILVTLDTLVTVIPDRFVVLIPGLC